MIFYLPLLAATSYAAMCPGSLSDTERNNFVIAHNALRSQVASGTFTAQGVIKPSATNMMSWDCSLEASAQQYVNSCPDDHSGTPNVGENMYWSWSTEPISTTGSGTDASNSWGNEFQDYGWDSITFNGQSDIGHATQMVWATSNRIGCGIALCPSTEPDFPYQLNIVCQYTKAGNVMGASIYQTGTKCSRCPSGSTCNAYTGLCG